jgi:hypothetical protein
MMRCDEACGGGIAPAQHGDGIVRRPARSGLWGAHGRGPASITVSATYDQSSCCYVEGFIPFVRIVGSGVDVKKEFRLDDGGMADVVLEVPQGGEYTLKSWVEPCAANCGAPRDPPTDHCSASVTVPDGENLQGALTIRSAHPCQLSVAGP